MKFYKCIPLFCACMCVCESVYVLLCYYFLYMCIYVYNTSILNICYGKNDLLSNNFLCLLLFGFGMVHRVVLRNMHTIENKNNIIRISNKNVIINITLHTNTNTLTIKFTIRGEYSENKNSQMHTNFSSTMK